MCSFFIILLGSVTCANAYSLFLVNVTEIYLDAASVTYAFFIINLKFIDDITWTVSSRFFTLIKFQLTNICKFHMYKLCCPPHYPSCYIVKDTEGKNIAVQFQYVTWLLEKALAELPYEYFEISDEVQEQVKANKHILLLYGILAWTTFLM